MAGCSPMSHSILYTSELQHDGSGKLVQAAASVTMLKHTHDSMPLKGMV